MVEPQVIAAKAIQECRDSDFGLAKHPRQSALNLVTAGLITPEQAGEGIRNKYAADASKGMYLLCPDERERNDSKDFKAALDALEAAVIAYLYA